jgi:septal ring factor EnvC (AmiA/AmiB activator)
VTGLSGCDYWPPALQAEIEQLRVQIDTVTREKSELQSQVDELTKTKRELIAKVDELTRLNQEKSTLIAGLQRQLVAGQAKAHPPTKAASKTKTSTPHPVRKPNSSRVKKPTTTPH